MSIQEAPGELQKRMYRRVRPFPERENQDIENHVVHYPGEGQILVEKDRASKPKPFTFNMVFEPESSQQDVFENSGIQRMIDLALQGYNFTCCSSWDTNPCFILHERSLQVFVHHLCLRTNRLRQDVHPLRTTVNG